MENVKIKININISPRREGELEIENPVLIPPTSAMNEMEMEAQAQAQAQSNTLTSESHVPTSLNELADPGIRETDMEVAETQELGGEGEDILKEVGELGAGVMGGEEVDELTGSEGEGGDILREVAELGAGVMEGEESDVQARVEGVDILSEVAELGTEVMTNVELDIPTKLDGDEGPDILSEVAKLGAEVMRNEELEIEDARVPDILSETAKLGAEKTKNEGEFEVPDILPEVSQLGAKVMKTEELDSQTEVKEVEISVIELEVENSEMEGVKDEIPAAAEPLNEIRSAENFSKVEGINVEGSKDEEPVTGKESCELEDRHISGLEDFGMEVHRTGEPIVSEHSNELEMANSYGLDDFDAEFSRSGDSTASDEVRTLKDFDFGVEEVFIDVATTGNQAVLDQVPENETAENADDAEKMEQDPIMRVEWVTDTESVVPEQHDEIEAAEASTDSEDAQIHDSGMPVPLEHIAENGIADVENTIKDTDEEVEWLINTGSVISEQHNEIETAETSTGVANIQIQETEMNAALEHVAENKSAEIFNADEEIDANIASNNKNILSEQHNEVGAVKISTEPEAAELREPSMSASNDEVASPEISSEGMPHDVEATKVHEPEISETTTLEPAAQGRAIPETKVEVANTEAAALLPESVPDIQLTRDVEPPPEVEPFSEPLPDIEPFSEPLPDIKPAPNVGQNAFAGTESQVSPSSEHSDKIESPRTSSEVVQDHFEATETPEDVVRKSAIPKEAVLDPENELKTTEPIERFFEQAHIEDMQERGETEYVEEVPNSNTTSDPQDGRFDSSSSQELSKPEAIKDESISIVETTLMPLKEIASDATKRVEASEMTNDQFSTPQDTNEKKNGPATPQRTRANSESADLPVAKYLKLDEENGDAIQRQFEGDEPLEMPENKKRKRTRTHEESDLASQTPSKRIKGPQADIIDLSSSPVRAPVPVQIVDDEESIIPLGDGEDDDDDELEFLQSVKHIRKPRGEEKVANRPVQETVNLADSSEPVLTPSPTTATGDAPDTKAAEEVKDAPKRVVKPWAAQERYNRTKAIIYNAPKPAPGSSPPVQQQRDQDPQMISHTHKKSSRPGGSLKVGNFLNGNNSYHPPPRSGQTQEQPNNPGFRSQVPKEDCWDGSNMYGSQYGRHGPEYQNQRQGMNNEDVIDLVGNQPGPSSRKEAASGRSGHNHTNHSIGRSTGSKNGHPGVDEYQSVERHMESGSRSRNRNGNSSNGQAKVTKAGMVTNGSQSTFKHGSVNEDPNDPIQLDSDHDLQPSRVKPPYKGTANLGSARANDKTRLTGNNTTKSLHFSTNGHANPNPTPRGRNAQTSRRQSEGEDSMDELSGPAPGPAPYTSSQDRRARNEAKSLLKSESSSHNGVKSTSSHPRVTDSPDASDEESQPDPSANIQRINWETSEELSLKGEKYPLLLVFTQHEDEQWLTEVPKNSWFLLLNHSTKMLSCYNFNRLIWDMPLLKIRSLEHNKNSSMMLILKSADTITKGSRVHLKLHSADDSNKLCQSLRKIVTLSNKEVEHFEKVFRVAVKKAKERIQEKLQRADPGPSKDLEIELLTNKKQRREDKERSSSRNAKDSHTLDVFETAPVRSQRLAKGMTEAAEPITGNDRSRSTNKEPVNSPNDRPVNKPVHDTRSSNRSRYFTPHVLEKVRTRTPSPERWTTLHSGWEKSWRGSVVYPPQGKNKATVDQRDIPRLDYGEFLNDNLIQFQLNWLEQELLKRDPAAANRVLFMNTFFYERLMQDAKAGKINYKAVERWTSRIDIFSYDYIIVPVNESVHWYLAIICNAPRLINPPPPEPLDEQEQEPSNEEAVMSQAPALAGASSASSDSEMSKKVISMTLEGGNSQFVHSDEATFQQPASVEDRATSTTSIDVDDAEGKTASFQGATRKTPVKKSKTKSSSSKNDTSQPRIIILDSLDGTHPRTTSNLRQYLHFEAEAKLGLEITTPKVIGMTARNIAKQDNYWDCGVYLLTYVEEFIKDPDRFIKSLYPLDPIDLTYEEIQWPKPVDQRDKIRERLMRLQEEQAIERDRKAKEKADMKLRKSGKKTDAVAQADKFVEGTKNDPHSSADGLPRADKAVEVSKTAPPLPHIVDTETMENSAESADAIKPLVQVTAHRPAESPESPSASDTNEAVISSASGDSKQDSPARESLGFIKALGAKLGWRNSSTQDTLVNSPASLESPVPSESENRDLDEVLETPQESEDDQHAQAETESWRGIESPTPEIQDKASTTSATKEVVDLLDDVPSQARALDLHQSQREHSMQNFSNANSHDEDVNEDDEMLLPGNSSPRSPRLLSSSDPVSQGSDARDCAPLPESQPLQYIEQDSGIPVSEPRRPRDTPNGQERKRKHEDDELNSQPAQRPRLDQPATSQQNMDVDKHRGRKRSRSEAKAADERPVQHNFPEHQSTERMRTPEQFADESKASARKQSSIKAVDKQDRRKRRRAEEGDVASELVENTSGASEWHQDQHRSHRVESHAAPPRSIPDASGQSVEQEQRKSPRGKKRATATVSLEAATNPTVAKKEQRSSHHGEQQATTSEFFRDPSDAAVVGQHSIKTPKTPKRMPRFVTDQEA